MNRKLSRLSLLLLAAMFALPSVAGAATVPSETTLYLRSNSAPACADQVLSLSTRAGSGESVCGYRNGAPFGEVYEQTGLADGTKSFTGTAGMPAVVDATRDVTGTITVGSYVSELGGGVGQIVLDLELLGFSGASSVPLGSVVVEQDLDPTKDNHEIPFTINIPEGANAKELTNLTIAVDVRGLHMGHGFLTLDGLSKFKLPTLVEEATTTP